MIVPVVSRHAYPTRMSPGSLLTTSQVSSSAYCNSHNYFHLLKRFPPCMYPCVCVCIYIYIYIYIYVYSVCVCVGVPDYRPIGFMSPSVPRTQTFSAGKTTLLPPQYARCTLLFTRQFRVRLLECYLFLHGQNGDALLKASRI